jgi:hypothetical protein
MVDASASPVLSPRMLAASVLSALPYEPPPSAAAPKFASSSSAFRRRPNVSWRAAPETAPNLQPPTLPVGPGVIAHTPAGRVHFHPYKARPKRANPPSPPRLRLTEKYALTLTHVCLCFFQMPPTRMVTNQQIEQRKRAQKQMEAAAEYRAKVRSAPSPIFGATTTFGRPHLIDCH